MKRIFQLVSAVLLIIFMFISIESVAQQWKMPKQITDLLKEREKEKGMVCESAREYITAIEYLRENEKKLGLNERQMRKIAMRVSAGCTGAASRFVRALELLIANGLPGAQAVKLSLRLANKGEPATKSFISVFKSAFLQKYLDLSLLDSVLIAKRLSLDINGDPKISENDFNKTVRFCMTSKDLELPRPYCAGLAKDIASLSEKYQKELSSSFSHLVKYLLNNKKSKLSIEDSIKWSKKVVSFGPMAEKNFINSYEYAISKEGLGFSIQKSLKFALKIAKQSFKENSKNYN